MLYLHNSSTNTRPMQPAGAPANSHHAWAAEPDACPDGADGSCAALAVFNAGNVSSQVVVNLTSLRLGSSNIAAPAQLCGRNLWTRRPLVPTPVVDVFAPKVRGGPPHWWFPAHTHASTAATPWSCTLCSLALLQLHAGRRDVRVERKPPPPPIVARTRDRPFHSVLSFPSQRCCSRAAALPGGVQRPAWCPKNLPKS